MAVEISVIKDNGEEVFLNLFPDTEAQFQQKSPVFEFNSIPGSYSFGIEFPAEGNELALGFQVSPFVSDKPVFLESRFYHNGAIKYRGRLLVERINSSREGDVIDSSFVVNGWASLIEGKSIREVCTEVIELGGNQPDIAAEAKALSQLSYPDSKVYFSPFKNTDHYSVDDGYSGEEFNSYDQSAQAFRYNVDGSTAYGLSASVYMLEVLRQCFEYFGYTVSGDAFDHDGLKKILVDSLTSLDDVGTLESCLLSLSTDEYYPPLGGSTDPVWDVIEEDYTIAGIDLGVADFYTLPQYGDYQIDLTIVLGAVVGDLTLRCTHPEYNGINLYTYTGSGNETLEVSVPLTFTGFDLDVGFYFQFDGGFGEGTIKEGSTFRIYPVDPLYSNSNRWVNSFKLGDCLPDQSVSDFIKAVRKIGVNIFFDDISKTALATTTPSILSKASIPISGLSIDREREIKESKRITLNWSSSKVNNSGLRDLGTFETESDLPTPVPGRLAHVRQTNNYYTPKLPTGASAWEWVIIGQKVEGYTTGEGSAENISSSAKLPEVQIISMDGEDVLTRVFKETGASLWQEQGLNDYPLRFSLAHGFQSGSVGLYPESTPYDYNYTGSSVMGISLLFEREGVGLYELFWREFILKLYGSSTTTTRFLLSKAPGELLRRKIFHENVEYLVEKITPEYSRNNLVEAILELRKLNVLS